MRITLITACRNAKETLPTALESVARQSLSSGIELEHIVVDGASTDGSPSLLADWENHLRAASRPGLSFRFVSETDRGLYDAINKGIRLATGDIVGILNADDVLASDTVISRIAAVFRAHHETDCAYGTVRFVNELGGPTVRRCFARLWRPWMLQWGYMPPHPAVFIRRTRYADWGFYSPDRSEYQIAADFELLIRYFRVHHMKAVYSNVCTTVMRTGGVSTRNLTARRRLNAEIIKGNRANGYFCCWPMLLPKYLVKIWEVLLPRLGFDGRRRPYPSLKRALDILLSGCAILLLSPLLVPVMVALKLTGEHYVFYGQTRIGLHNRPFKIWKFATMLLDSPNMTGGLHTTKGDPRILPLGGFLRKTKINEIPQIFNIFLGDMSIVGPRPLVDKTFAPYSDEVKSRIYSVRPGLTGIGSIVFRDEERILTESPLAPDVCYATVIAPYKGALEMWYLDHFGFVTDLKIVFLTAWTVLFPRSDRVFHAFRDLPKRPEGI